MRAAAEVAAGTLAAQAFEIMQVYMRTEEAAHTRSLPSWLQCLDVSNLLGRAALAGMYIAERRKQWDHSVRQLEALLACCPDVGAADSAECAGSGESAAAAASTGYSAGWNFSMRGPLLQRCHVRLVTDLKQRAQPNANPPAVRLHARPPAAACDLYNLRGRSVQIPLVSASTTTDARPVDRSRASGAVGRSRRRSRCFPSRAPHTLMSSSQRGARRGCSPAG